MKRRMAVCAALLCGAAMVCSGQGATDTTPKKPRKYLSLGFTLQVGGNYAGRTMLVSTVPEFARQIPIHKDDPGAGRMVTIPDAPFFQKNHRNGYAQIGPEIGFFNRLYVRAGISPIHDMPWVKPQKGHGDSTHEISQWGPSTSRGTGTALVYAAFVPTTHHPRPKYAEAELRLHRALGVFYGISRFHTDFGTETGWDRWDTLQLYKTHSLARYTETTRYVGMTLYMPPKDLADPDFPVDVGISVYGGFSRGALSPLVPEAAGMRLLEKPTHVIGGALVIRYKGFRR